MLKISLGVLSLLLVQTIHANPISSEILARKFAFDDHKRDLVLLDHRESAAIVVIAQGNRCPIMRKNYPAFIALENEFKKKHVEFFFVNANPQDSVDDITSEAGLYGLKNGIVLDVKQELIRELGLSTVGEAAVLVPDSKPELWKVVYRGGLSDRVNFDRALAKPKAEFLREALQDIISGRTVRSPKQPVFGCSITFK
jgi:hypothetical protein